MLEIRLFGPGQVRNGSRVLAGFPKQQYYQVLCYLIISRQPHTREKLASTFWTNYTTSTSRKYLRDALWRLRHALKAVEVPLESLLCVTETQVSYNLPDQGWLDVQQFEAGITPLRGTPPDSLDPLAVERAEQAVRLYTGDLLDGLYQDWCLDERERLRLLYLGALGNLMAYHEAHGDDEKAIAYGERILASDGTREAVHRQMMRLHHRAGNRDAAIRQYRSCVRILQETLGIPPLEETTRLYAHILNNDALAAQPLQLPPSADARVEAAAADGTALRHVLRRVRHIYTLMDQLRAELNALEDSLNGRRAFPDVVEATPGHYTLYEDATVDSGRPENG